MPLTLRAKETRILGFGRKYSRQVAVGTSFTIPDAVINADVLASVRTHIAAGLVEVVSSTPDQGLQPVRHISSRNQLHIRLGLDQGAGVLLPNGATVHKLVLGGAEILVGDGNVDGSTTATLLTNFLAALAASTDFQATGAVVRTSLELALPAAVAATRTLTSNNTNVSNNDTVTIGAKTYTFKTALTPAEGEVLIGADADASLLNLIRAINRTGTPGTHYQCAAAHPTVSAAASVTSHAFAVTALTAGSAGNSIATTEAAATLSWGGATLAGGADTQALVVIDGDGVADWGAFEDATSLTDESDEELVTPYIDLTFFNATTHDTVDTNTVLYASRTATAGDVTRGYIAFDTGLTDLSTKFAVRITRSGTEIEHNGTVEVRGSRTIVIQNNGNTDYQAGDVIQVFAAGTD